MLQELYEQYLKQKKVLRDLSVALDQRTKELRAEVRLELDQEYQSKIAELLANIRQMTQHRLALEVRLRVSDSLARQACDKVSINTLLLFVVLATRFWLYASSGD